MPAFHVLGSGIHSCWVSAMSTTNSHGKLLTVLTIDPHTTLGIEAYALDDTHTPFLELKAHHRTFLDTRSKALSRSTKAKWIIFSAVIYFSSSWRTTKMASVVLLPGTKPNCISSIFTISRMKKSSTRSSRFMTWSVSLRSRKLAWSRASPLPLQRFRMKLSSQSGGNTPQLKQPLWVVSPAQLLPYQQLSAFLLRCQMGQ